jgi:ankyrin repeat protein
MSSIRWSAGLLMLMLHLPLSAQIWRELLFPGQQPSVEFTQGVDSTLLLITAADQGDLDSVVVLIEQGFDVNKTTREGVSPLMYAASGGFLEIVKVFAESGADVNAIPYNGLTALASACINNHYEVALYLLQNGADTEIADVNGVTPLFYAAAYDHFEITELLLMFGADPLHTDYEGATVLHAAGLYAQPDIAWLLLDFGAGIDIRDDFGFTPLMMAIQQGKDEMADYLLENNASIYVRTRDGMSPLALAVATNHASIAERLIGLGANPKQRISYSENLMNIARRRGDENLISLLQEHDVRANIIPGFKTLRLSGNVLLNTTDFFNGLQAGLEDDKYNLLLTAGWYTRPVRRSVLTEFGDQWYDQLWEQRQLFYGGLHRTFPRRYSLSLNEEGFYAGVSVLFSTGHYWGTYGYPEPGWHLMPSAGYYKEGSWWFYNAGYEYLQLKIREKSPHRIRVGAGIRFRIKRDPVIYRTTYW